MVSTDFMTGTGVSNIRTVRSRMDKIDISSVLNALLIKDTTVLGMIGMKGVAKNTEHRWLEDDLNSTVFYGSTSGAAGATFTLKITSPSTTAALLKIARNDTIFTPENGEWYGKFSAAPTATSQTVGRYGALSTVFATTFATAAAGTKFYVVGMPKKDIDTASTDISKTRTTRRNFTQIFERGIQIAETREHIDLYAVGSELELQTKYRTLEMKRELGIAVINSVAYWDESNYTDNVEDRTMCGIIQLIRDPDLDGTPEDTTVINADGAELTADLLNGVAKKMYDLGGLGSDSNVVLCVSPVQAQHFSNIATNNLRSTSPQLKYRGFFADRFVSDFGGIEFKVVMDRWIPDDKIIFLDLNRVSCMPLQGDTWALKEMAQTGRSRNFQTSGQYTIQMENAGECHGLLFNLKT